MAPSDLIPTRPRGFDGGATNDSGHGSLIRRPAELVELAELVYRGVFSAGLLVASIATLYATALGALQPRGHRIVGITVCSVLLLGQLLATHQRVQLYPLLRRRPWLVLVPAVAIGAGAWATGSHNQQLFYVLTILLGVLGAAVPLRAVAVASLVAAAGMAAPHISDGSWTIGAAVVAGILPPLFWLILEQLTRFMLRLHRTTSPESGRRTRQVQARSSTHREPVAAASGNAEPADADTKDPTVSDASQFTRDRPTSRQHEVVLLVAEGLQHVEIAKCLGIGAAQVGRHLANACGRAGVATNGELMAWAKRHGLIPPEDGSPEIS